MKRLTALILMLVMTLTLLPASVRAEEAAGPEAPVPTGADPGQYAILELTAEAQVNTLSVRLRAAEDCWLIAAEFTEEGKLLGAGIQPVQGGDGEQLVSVPVSGKQPEYFVARAFLLARDRFTPLSAEYVCYDYAAFMDKTIHDFPGQTVLQFDQQEDVNFAALASDVVELYQGTDFRAAAVEETENGLSCTLSGAAAAALRLRAGNHVVVLDGQEPVCALVVGTAERTGDTVVLTADSAAPADLGAFFDFIRLDVTTGEIDPFAGELAEGVELGEGVELYALEETEEMPELLSSEPDANAQFEDEYSIKFALDSQVQKNLRIQGTAEMNWKVRVSLAYGKDRLGEGRLSVHTEIQESAALMVALKGTAGPEMLKDFSVPLGKFPPIPVAGGFLVMIQPEIRGQVNLEGQIRVQAKISNVISKMAYTDGGLQESRTEPVTGFSVTGQVGYRVELGVRVTASVELLTGIAGVSVYGQGGVESDGTLEKTLVELGNGAKHLCQACVTGHAGFRCRVGLEIGGKIGNLTYKIFSAEAKTPLYGPFDYYLSFDSNGVFKMERGVCPNKGFYTGFIVEDQDTQVPLPSASVSVRPVTYGTYFSGMAGDATYLAVGQYEMRVSCACYHEKVLSLSVNGKSEQIIKLYPEDGPNPDATASAVAYEGTYSIGEPYVMYENGTLHLKYKEGVGGMGESQPYPWWGSGNMPDWERRRAIKTVVLDEGLTSVSTNAFKYCNNLVEVHLPASLKQVNREAFEGCTSLKTINFPHSLEKVLASAFSGCTALEGAVYLPGVTLVDGKAFNGCTGIEEVSVGGGTIEHWAFRDCKKLEKLHLGQVTSIGANAFENCASLQEVSLPDTLTGLGQGAFQNCASLTSIRIPGSVADVSRYTFNNCFHLESVTLESGVKSVGDFAFNGATTLRYISLPDTLESIGGWAFFGSGELRTVTIPASVTTLGANAFNGNTALRQVTLEGAIEEMGAGVFNGCSALTDVRVTNAKVLGNSTFENCYNLERLSLPDSLRSIGDRAFYNCRGLTELTIPASVTSIGADAFTGCTNLKTLNLNGPLAASGTFRDFDGLTQVNFGDSASHVGTSMFENCDGLTEIALPETLKSVGENGFRNCDSLTEVTIPAATESLGAYAFFDCTGLERVTVLGCDTMAQGVFQNCTNLTSATLGDISLVGASMFDGCTSLREITIPGSAKEIGQCAFLRCASLEKAVLESGVETLASYSFQDCTSMSEITLPASVTSIAPSAFWGCDGLSDVYYQGTQAQWEQISIGSDNHWLTDAAIHFAG